MKYLLKLFRICSECSVNIQNVQQCSDCFRLFSNVQTLLRISSTKNWSVQNFLTLQCISKYGVSNQVQWMNAPNLCLLQSGAIHITTYCAIWSLEFVFIKCFHIPVQKKYTTHSNKCRYLKIRCFKAGSINAYPQSLPITLYLYVWLEL